MTISVHPMIFVQEGPKKISVKSGSIPYVCKTAKRKEKMFSSYFNSNANEENDYFDFNIRALLTLWWGFNWTSNKGDVIQSVNISPKGITLPPLPDPPVVVVFETGLEVVVVCLGRLSSSSSTKAKISSFTVALAPSSTSILIPMADMR